MILKTKEGHYVELTKEEYVQFVAELVAHFNAEQKLTIVINKDYRIQMADMLMKAVADYKGSMSDENKNNYFALALSLVKEYNEEKKT